MTSGGPISAAVLAGGASRRFGSDKALAPVPGGGETILGRTVRVLQLVADDVTIIAPPDRPYDLFGVPVVGEHPAGEGPLGGLIAALTLARHPRCLIVACDLPFLSPRLLRWMGSRPVRGDALVPVVGPDDPRQQPLHAIYGQTCLEPAARLFAGGERRMLALMQAIHVEFVGEDDLRAFDPALASFVNVNASDDWRAAERRSVDPDGRAAQEED